MEALRAEVAPFCIHPTLVTPDFFRTELLTIAAQEPPPRRFIAGADAIGTAEQKIAELREDIESNRALSTSLTFDAQTSPRAPPGRAAGAGGYIPGS